MTSAPVRPRTRPAAYVVGTIDAPEAGTRAPAVRWRDGTVDWQDLSGQWATAPTALLDTFAPTRQEARP